MRRRLDTVARVFRHVTERGDHDLGALFRGHGALFRGHGVPEFGHEQRRAMAEQAVKDARARLKAEYGMSPEKLWEKWDREDA